MRTVAPVRDRAVAAPGAELRLAGGAIVSALSVRFAFGHGLDAAVGRTVDIRTTGAPDTVGPAAPGRHRDCGRRRSVGWLEAGPSARAGAMVSPAPGLGGAGRC